MLRVFKHPIVASAFFVSAHVVCVGQTSAPFPPADGFTVVALPDTQTYVYKATGRNGATHDMFNAQTAWIVQNRTAKNIVYVAHLGDLSEFGDYAYSYGLSNSSCTSTAPNTNRAEWVLVDNAMSNLDAAGIPYGVAVGNHDQSPLNGGPNPPNTSATTSCYDTFFGPSRFSGRPYVGANYTTTNNRTHYDKVTVGSTEYDFIFLEYDDNTNAIGGGGTVGTKEVHDNGLIPWMTGVLGGGKKSILITHYMGNTQNPSVFGEQGLRIFNAAKAFSNAFLALGGHIGGAGRRQDITGTGSSNMISTIVSDYQSETNGGYGFLRLYEISQANNTLSSTTYSPYIASLPAPKPSAYKSDPRNAFQVQLAWKPRLDIFYRNNSDDALGHLVWNGASWGAPTFITGGTLKSAPVAVSRGANLIDIFYRGANFNLKWRSWNGHDWSVEHEILNPGTGNPISIAGSPAAAARGLNSMDVFWQDGTTLQQIAWDGNTWTSPSQIATLVDSPPAAVAWNTDRMDVVFLRAGVLFQKTWTSGSWTGAAQVGGVASPVTFQGRPSITSSQGYSLNIIAWGTDGRPYHKYFTQDDAAGTNATWSGWTQKQGLLASGPSAASAGPDRRDVVFVDGGAATNGQITDLFWNGSTWQLAPLGATPNGSPAITSWSHFF